MTVDHIEVALVHRHVDGLANGPARVVKCRGHVGQLHQRFEVGQRGVAAAFVVGAVKRRAVNRGEDRALAADFDVTGRVAGVLGKGGRCRLAQLTDHALGEADAGGVCLAFGEGDIGALVPPSVDGVGILGNVDADFLQDGLGVGLDQRQTLLGEDVDVGELAVDDGQLLDAGGGTGAGGAAAATTTATATSLFNCGHE